MRLSLVATTLFAALPALAASQPANADGAVARGMGHTVNSRRAAHRAFARRGGDGERRGPNGKKCRPKSGKGSKGATAGSGSTATTAPASEGTAAAAGNDSGDQSQNWIGQDSNEHNGEKQDSTSITSSASSAGVSPSGAAGNATSVGHEFYQSETSSTVSSGASSATSSTATGAAPSPPSTEGAEGATTTSSEGANTSSASPSPSPSPSADGGNNSGGDDSGGNNNSGGGGLSWLNGVDPNIGAQGQASYYDVQAGNTYCGGRFSNDDAVVALSQDLWNQISGGGYSTGPPCGKKVSITWKGQTKTATIQDQCPGCPADKLDLAEGFWASFTGGDKSLGILGLGDKPDDGNPPCQWKFID